MVDSIVRDALSRQKDGPEMGRAWSAVMLTLPTFAIAYLIVALGTVLGGIDYLLKG